MKKIIFITLSIVTLSGCSTVEKIVDQSDAGCGEFEIDGYFTDSNGSGRIIKVPDGVEITPELITALCEK